MKTILHLRTLFLPILCINLLAVQVAKSQTYTTITNGAWTSAATWQGGSIPNAANVPSTAVINIRHIVTYSGGNILNNGTINIANPGAVSPKLIVASGVTLQISSTGKLYMNNAEYRQYRFAGGLETGVPQAGSIINQGGVVDIKDSYIEVAENFENKNSGTRKFYNASVTIGKTYTLNSNGIDSIMHTSVSVGWHGSGDFTMQGSVNYYKSARVQIASLTGNFKIAGSIASGDIDYIQLKNHFTGVVGTGTITVTNGVTITGGLKLNAYCVLLPANYIPNGKFSGAQTSNCSLNLFPAGLLWAPSQASFNLTKDPVLVTGTDRQVGAQYKYEGVAPGVDLHVKIDSLVGNATIVKLDDNAAGTGFMEGFQPQIKSGSIVGQSYAVFTFNFKITGTSLPHTLSSFSLTALDIDGSNTLKEFDEINLGTGATASYVMASPSISLTEVAPGSFRGINANSRSVSGVDTSALQYMFTVTNTNVSSYTVKTGMQTSQASNETRLYSMYMKGFVYPAMSTLPVKLESFTAQLNDDKADLHWVSSYEKDVNYFSVEKSVDGKAFKQAGIVFAVGNSSAMNSYSFPDKNIDLSKPGVIYYRLRSVDIDGSFEYSAIRMIKIGTQNKNALSIQAYPNPVSNELRITVPSVWQNKRVSYELISSNGYVTKKLVTGNASQTETINVQSLAPGFYVVTASCNGERIQQMIIKK